MLQRKWSLSTVILTLSGLLLSSGVLAQSDNANTPDRIATKHAHSQVTEGIHFLVGLTHPGNAIPGDTRVDLKITVRSESGDIVGEFDTEMAFAGFAQIRFVSETGAGSLILFANDTVIGPVEAGPGGRVSYSIETEVPRVGRNPRTGETIPIPAGRLTTTAYVVDKSTGETKAGRSDALVFPNYHSRPYY